MVGSTWNLLNLFWKILNQCWLWHVLCISMTQLSINTFSPGIQPSLFNCAHVKRPALYPANFRQTFNQSRSKRIINIGINPQRSMNIASHRINNPINGQQGRMMSPTRNLLNKSIKSKTFRLPKMYIMIFLSNPRLAILINPQKQKLIDVHHLR